MPASKRRFETIQNSSYPDVTISGDLAPQAYELANVFYNDSDMDKYETSAMDIYECCDRLGCKANLKVMLNWLQDKRLNESLRETQNICL